MSQERSWIVAFPLSHAYLCANCNCVGNKADSCPVCAGHQLLSLEKVLDRPNQPEEPAS